MSLPENLRFLMDLRGVNQKSLALQCGYSHTYVRDILVGRNLNPAANKLITIAKVLGVPLTALTDMTIDELKVRATSLVEEMPGEAVQDASESALLRFWRLLDDGAKRRLLADIERAIDLRRL